MARRLRSAICVAALAAVAACSIAPSASEALTVGLPELEPTTGFGFGCAPSSSFCSFAQTTPPAAAPFDGLITRWRVRVLTGSGTVRLSILRPPGPAYLWASSTADQLAEAGLHAFETHIPIARGDQIAVTIHEVVLLARGADQGFAGSSIALWNPAPADGTSPPPSNTVADTVIGLNADIERDVDGDGLGDETQDTDDDGDGVPDTSDNCPTTAGPSQTDTDGDGQGDICDDDDDNDGLPDSTETQLGSNPSNPDTDGDGSVDGSDRCLLRPGPGGCPGAAVLALEAPARLRRRAFARGVRFTVTPDQPVALRVSLVTAGRGNGTILAERSLPPAAGARSIRLKPSQRAAKGVKRVQLRVLAINADGAQTERRKTVRITR